MGISPDKPDSPDLKAMVRDAYKRAREAEKEARRGNWLERIFPMLRTEAD